MKLLSGDYVICRTGGVWLVKECDGGTAVLEEHETGAVKSVPAASGEIVRGLVDEATLRDAIDRIAFIRTIQAPNDKIRMEFYREAMGKFEEIEWIRVIKSVYLRGQEKRLAPLELELGAQAKRYFHGEVSVVLGMPMTQVEQYIADAVSKDTW
jgi:RNA polymerase-interacting CarD/CdnL/TRCF family regulator